MKRILILLTSSLIMLSCGNRTGREVKTTKEMNTDSTSLYGYNLGFLKKHVSVIELRNGEAALAVIPQWQGRVMTSTAQGEAGFSFGWINHKLISEGKIQLHINAFGGEERLWLGPEGGQFSIFFKKGAKFEYSEWQTPAFMDTTPFEVIESTDTTVLLACNTEAVNYSGTNLRFRIERSVSLLTSGQLEKELGISVAGLNSVAYKSKNSLINKGDKEWVKESGLLSIWMLGMFNPSPSVVVAVPFNQGDEKIMGPAVNDNYFGKISPDRLKIAGNHIFFRADGKSRGKIGLPPLRATGTIGSYDAANNILTLLICKIPAGNTEYVNSAWEIQKNPYSGDAMNSYNDGPLEDGSQMGPFYEIETSSPAAALKPGERIDHTQLTCHITGNKELLNAISLKVLGLPLSEIENAFK